jgi:urea transport system permease protein
LPEIWLFALGGLFIGVTLFLPKGILGLLSNYFATKQISNETSREVRS